MPMNPGMKMMMLNKAMKPDDRYRSEYSADGRRMIGYDRNEYGGGSRSEYGGARNESGGRYRNEYGGGARNEYEGAMYPANMYPGEPPMMIGDYRMTYPVENRRRSTRTGRFIRGEYDEPETRMVGYERNRMGGYEDEDWQERPEMNAGHGMKKHGGEDYYAAAMWKMPKSEHRGADREYIELDEKTANEWVKKLENADGSNGPHYKIDQVEQWRATNCMDCEKWEFFAVVNMMYADYCKTAEKMGINKIEFYGNLAKDFLHDPDATPNKFQKYMEYIAA